EKRNHPGSKLRQGFWMVFRLGVHNWGYQKTYILLYRMIKYNKNDRIRKKHECQKDNVNFSILLC
ncbi:hypothetical protein, partial [Streptococcus pneumoniae]